MWRLSFAAYLRADPDSGVRCRPTGSDRLLLVGERGQPHEDG